MSVLAEQTVQLWCVADESIRDRALLARYRHWLSADERARYQHIVCPRQQHQYLLTRALVRSVLSYYAPDIAPQDWVFSANAYGKPGVTHPSLPAGLSFNLSHTTGLIVLAVCAGAEVGIDVESLQRAGFSIGLAEHYFARPEVDALKRLPELRQPLRIFELWTLKEAFIKALGMGLSMSLKRFAYAFTGDSSLTLQVFDAVQREPEEMRLWSFALRQEYRLALVLLGAAKARPWHVETRRYVPGGDFESQELTLLRACKNNTEIF